MISISRIMPFEITRVHWATTAAAITLAAFPAPGPAQSGGIYDLSWSTLDGGGAGEAGASTGGNYSLSGTIGQPDARSDAMIGGTYSLVGGFWVIPSCTPAGADFNGDCSVDQTDFTTFDQCYTGSHMLYTSPGILPPGCTLTPGGDGRIAADFDSDGDVDQEDFGTFQRCYSGSGNPADPNCAN